MSRYELARAVLVAAAVVILPAAAFAQEVGVKAGLNAAWLTPLEDETPDITRRLGPVGGVWVRTPFARIPHPLSNIVAAYARSAAGG